MAPGVLLTDWPEVGMRRGPGGDLRVCSCSRGSGAGPESWAAFLSSRSGPRSDSPPIISQSDRVAGPACLSPVLNHSISARRGGGGRGWRRRRRSGISLVSKAKTSNSRSSIIAATRVQTNVCVVFSTHYACNMQKIKCSAPLAQAQQTFMHALLFWIMHATMWS